MTDPAGLEARLGHSFADKTLLAAALTHASAHEGRPGLPTNERLEFLGDRVLGLVVAARLYAQFPDAGEDTLAPRLNALVNRAACARAARAMDLGPHLSLSKAEAQTGGRDKDTILADACEAVIAAVFLDGGWVAASALIERLWSTPFAEAAATPKEPKAALQELAAARRQAPPVYQLVSKVGPDHAPRFTVAVTAAGLGAAEASGASKREAEQAAAAALLKEAGHG